jgi:hypothetical protein
LVVEFGLPLAGSRQEPFGYYFALSAEERANATRPLKRELRALAQRVHALEGHHALRELLGQIELELNTPPEAQA